MKWPRFLAEQLQPENNEKRAELYSGMVLPSGLFAESWYVQRYDISLKAGSSAAEHYRTRGWKKNYNPSPVFDSEVYSTRYLRDQNNSAPRIDPLTDCLTRVNNGKHVYFSSDLLKNTLVQLGLSGIYDVEYISFDELCSVGDIFNVLEQEGISAYRTISESRLFNEKWYRTTYSINETENALLHYLSNDNSQIAKPNRLFDPRWYQDQHTSQGGTIEFPFAHYITHGAKQNKEPSGYLDPFIFNKYNKCADIGYNQSNVLDGALRLASDNNKDRYADPIKYQMQEAIDCAVFDEDWYVKTYFHNQDIPASPILHYYNIGHDKGYWPNRYLNVSWYRERYMLLATDEFLSNALNHYINVGISKLYSPSISFSTPKLINQKSVIPEADSVSPEAYVINAMSCKGTQDMDIPETDAETILLDTLDASNIFDEEYYLENYKHVKSSAHTPQKHYLRSGEKKGFFPNRYFDTNWYTAQLKINGVSELDKSTSLLNHYLLEGRFMKIDPSPYFDSKSYASSLATKLEPHDAFIHYCSLPKDKQIVPTYDKETALIFEIGSCGLFLEDWYSNTHEDLRATSINFLEHYAVYGWKEGRNPNPYFDQNWYLSKYPHVKTRKLQPLLHYFQTGWRNGLDPSPGFSTKRYLDKHEDVRKAQVCPLTHYLQTGKSDNYQIFDSQDSTDRRSAVTTAAYKKNVPVDSSATFPVPESLRGITRYPRNQLQPKSKVFDPENLNIHWVIPDFSPGGGGHMTIFRIVHFLGLLGHTQTIWIEQPNNHKTTESAHDDILKHFQSVDVEVEFIKNNSLSDISADAVIATGWSTVWPSLSAVDVKRRFYFVQDYEPDFYPCGSASYLAELTYKEDLDCICAGPWLHSIMKDKYNLWSTHFPLCADKDIYKTRSYRRRSETPRIAFYARNFTPRRLVDLGLLALEVLAKKGLNFHVDMFGAELSLKSSPFPVTLHGVLSAEQLADLYRDTDIGVVFSGTNYSLIPQEMMACELPVIEVETECTAMVFPQGVLSTAEPHPDKIAEKIEYLLNHSDERQAQAKKGKQWVDSLNWSDAGNIVEAGILSRLQGTGYTPKLVKTKTTPKASVVIPVYNGGKLLETVIRKVLSQKAPWDFELIIIDSESTDDIEQFARQFENIRYHRIKKEAFQHGATRNLGVQMARGEFVAFLTQDALPVNDTWLYSLVNTFSREDSIAGVFGRHVAHTDASAFTRKLLDEHFSSFNEHPLVLSKTTDKARFDSGNIGWRRVLHFYSDNNSCLRKSVWKTIPYPEIDFGEDQAWADLIIKAGFSKGYAPNAVVAHSHDFGPEEQRIRSKEESLFFYEWFGYRLVKNASELQSMVQDMNDRDEKTAAELSISSEELARKFEINQQSVMGYIDGLHIALEEEKLEQLNQTESTGESEDTIAIENKSVIGF